MATNFSIVAWRIPWTEEPGRLQYMGVAKIRTWVRLHVFHICHKQEVGFKWWIGNFGKQQYREVNIPSTGKIMWGVCVCVDVHGFSLYCNSWLLACKGIETGMSWLKGQTFSRYSYNMDDFRSKLESGVQTLHGLCSASYFCSSLYVCLILCFPEDWIPVLSHLYDFPELLDLFLFH